MERIEQTGNGPRTTGEGSLTSYLLVLTLGFLALSGCGKSSTDESNRSGTADKDVTSRGPDVQAEALRLVEEMAAQYRKTASYCDQGKLTWTTRGKQGQSTQQLDCSVAFVRPNKLRVHVRGTTIVCDGRQLWARLPKDARARGQVLQRAAPRSLSMLDRSSSFDPNAQSLLTASLTQGIGGKPYPLQLLADDRPTEVLLSAERMTRLPAKQIDGHLCDGVEFELDSGKNRTVIWIDQQQKILRRFVYPDMAVGEGDDRTTHSLVADFYNATFAETIDKQAFRFAIAPNERRVKDFVVTPPDAPLHLLGTPIEGIEFVGFDGKTIKATSLLGQVVVLVFFGADDPRSVAALPHLMAVAERLKSPEKVSMIAVSTDPLSLTNQQLQASVGPLLAGGRLLRTPKIRTNNALGMKTLPTTLVLNRQGVVEYLQPSFYPDAPRELSEKIDSVVAGHSWHQKIRQEYEWVQQQHRIKLNAVSAIAAASRPQRIRLTQEWKSVKGRNPGNLLVIEEPEHQPRILVLDDSRNVVELNPQGNVLSDTRLAIPAEAKPSFLRTAVDGQGKRFFVACGPLEKQLHLFDAKWQPVATFPEGDGPLIADVQFADLAGDGSLSVAVGYMLVRMHMISLKGKLLWTSKAVGLIRNLIAIEATDQRPGVILCATAEEEIVPISANRRSLPKWSNELGMPLSFVATGPQQDGTRNFCMMAMTRLGETVVGGLPYGSAKATWAYRLPPGRSEYPVEPIAWGKLVEDGGDGQWIVAAGDGSVHLFTQQGQLIDQFNYGQEISGIAVTRFGKRAVLLISSPHGVEALSVTIKR